jgi:hypothetical protein
MTKQRAIQKLYAAGYKVTFCTSGNVIASKGQRSYKAATINSLIKIIF